MTTPEIIAEIAAIRIADSEDYELLERINELMDALRQNSDSPEACAALMHLLERHPDVEFGTPGEPVHTLENYAGHYEPLLMASLKRQPALMTVWMLNRILNSATGYERRELLEALQVAAAHPAATALVRQSALDFLAHQSSKKK